MIMLALVNNQPQVLNLLQMLQLYIKHQEDVVRRRTIYELNKAEERAHILKGLLIALDHIDEVIRIIRSSANTAEAKQRLMEAFDLSDAQSQAIVDMRLRALTGLEREKLEKEYEELMKRIGELKAILADNHKLLGVIREEITLIRDKFGDERRTAIGIDEFDIDIEDLIDEQDVVIAKTNMGYIKRMTVDTFKTQNRGGKGIKGMQTIEDDVIEDLLMTTTHHYLMFFTNLGRVYRLKGYEIPEYGRNSRGTALVNLLMLQPEEKITAIIPIKIYDENQHLFMCTRKGIVKKTSLTDFAHVRKNGLVAITLQDNDELIEVKYTEQNNDILLVTRFGQCIRFNEADVRQTGRTSMGVRGIRLGDGDEVVGMQLNVQGEYLLVASENGFGKMTAMSEFSVQNRGGKGVKCYHLMDKTGPVIGAKAVDDTNEIMIINTEGIIIRISCDSISKSGRNSSGVKLIHLNQAKDEKIASIAKVRETAISEEEQVEE